MAELPAFPLILKFQTALSGARKTLPHFSSALNSHKQTFLDQTGEAAFKLLINLNFHGFLCSLKKTQLTVVLFFQCIIMSTHGKATGQREIGEVSPLQPWTVQTQEETWRWRWSASLRLGKLNDWWWTDTQNTKLLKKHQWKKKQHNVTFWKAHVPQHWFHGWTSF